MTALALALISLTLAAGEPAFPPPSNLKDLRGGVQADVTQALADHGFAVIDGPAAMDVYNGYYQLSLEPVPVLVTSDAMLYLWFEAHRSLTRDLEAQHLLPLTQTLVAAWWVAQQDDPPGAEPSDRAALAVAARLAGVQAVVPDAIAPEVDATLAKIAAADHADVYPGEDWTQYKPRGPYAKSEPLQRYWRLTKWLGRHLIPLDGDLATAATLRRAAWWCDLTRRAPAARAAWDRLAAARRWLSGPFALSGVDELDRALATTLGPTWRTADLTDDACARVRAVLRGEGYTRVVTRTRAVDPAGPHFPTRAFAPLPEHELPDTATLQIAMDTHQPPSGLAVAAALGLPQAAAHAGWQPPALAPADGSLYSRWLHLLTTLPSTDPRAPGFMRTGAWQDKTLLTALTSWAHLRHNYLLYGAPTWMWSASPPDQLGFVEPLPAFWHGYEQMVRDARAKLAELGFASTFSEGVLDKLATESHQLGEDSELELAGLALPDNGRHLKQFCDFARELPHDSPLVVADIATTNDGVVHAASGLFQLIIAQFDRPGRAPLAAMGFVGSYYEFTEPGLTRLTDQAWRGRVMDDKAPPSPDWARSFLVASDRRSAARPAKPWDRPDLLAGELPAVVARLERMRDEHRGGDDATLAELLLGQAYLDHGDLARARAAWVACDSLPGCPAREEAELRLRRIGPDHWRGGLDGEHAARLTAILDATRPRPGLSPEDELRRQDRRARALLNESEPDCPRVLRECPQSQLSKVAQFYLAGGDKADAAEGAMFFGLPSPAAEWVPKLEAFERAHAGSELAERAAAVQAALYKYEDPLRSWHVLAPYLTQPPPAAEPYPLAVAFLRDPPSGPTRRAAPVPPAAVGPRPALAEATRLAQRQGPVLLIHGEFDLFRTAMTAVLAAGPPRPEDPTDTARRFLLALATRAPEVARLWARGTGEQGDPAALRELAQRFPRDPLAPVALLRLGERADLERLRHDYPGTLEAQVAEFRQAIDAADFARAEALAKAIRAGSLTSAATGDWEDTVDHYLSSGEEERSRARELLRFLPGLTERELFLKFRHVSSADPPPGFLDDLLRRAGPHGPDLLMALDESYGANKLLEQRFPERAEAERHRYHSDELAGMSLAKAAVAVNAGAGPTYDEAVRSLTLSCREPTDEAPRPDAERLDVPAFLARWDGRPAAALVRCAEAERYLGLRWLERAVAIVTPATRWATPFRGRAGRDLEVARAWLAAEQAPPLRVVWRAPLGHFTYRRPDPRVLLAPGLVLVHGSLPDGTLGLTALDRADGHPRWQLATGPATVAVVGERILVSAGGQVTALDQAGQRVPRRAGESLPAAAVVPGQLVQPAAGRLKWQPASGGPAVELSPLPPTSPGDHSHYELQERPAALVAGRLLVRRERQLSAFDPAGGARLWWTPCPGASLPVADGELGWMAAGGAVTLLDLRSGLPLRRLRLPDWPHAPLVAEGRAYLRCGDELLAVTR